MHDLDPAHSKGSRTVSSAPWPREATKRAHLVRSTVLTVASNVLNRSIGCPVETPSVWHPAARPDLSPEGASSTTRMSEGEKVNEGPPSLRSSVHDGRGGGVSAWVRQRQRGERRKAARTVHPAQVRFRVGLAVLAHVARDEERQVRGRRANLGRCERRVGVQAGCCAQGRARGCVLTASAAAGGRGDIEEGRDRRTARADAPPRAPLPERLQELAHAGQALDPLPTGLVQPPPRVGNLELELPHRLGELGLVERVARDGDRLEALDVVLRADACGGVSASSVGVTRVNAYRVQETQGIETVDGGGEGDADGD